MKNDVGLLAFSASRRSKTGQEAPKTAPRRPNRPPREPQDGLRASDDGLRGAHDSSRAPEDGPKESQEGDASRTSKPSAPRGPPEAPRGPQEIRKRLQEAPSRPAQRPPKRRPDRLEQGLQRLQYCFEETPRGFPTYPGTAHKLYFPTFAPIGMGVHILVEHTSLVGPRACQFLSACSRDLRVLTYVQL